MLGEEIFKEIEGEKEKEIGDEEEEEIDEEEVTLFITTIIEYNWDENEKLNNQEIFMYIYHVRCVVYSVSS